MSGMKKMAEILSRAGPPRLQRPPRLPRGEQPVTSEPSAPEPSLKRTSTYVQPDAWAPSLDTVVAVTPVGEGKRKKSGRPPVEDGDKKRSSRISLALSKEEERIVRAAAHDAGQSVSAWAREVLFRHIGKQIPARPRK